ncbi:MAG: hypothetical protein WB392_03715 [Methanotrichaceae archaeon]
MPDAKTSTSRMALAALYSSRDAFFSIQSLQEEVPHLKATVACQGDH